MEVKKFLSVADHILGHSVHDAVNEQIGTIKDVFIDPEANRPVFAVLSTGGFLGIGSDTVVLPWHALDFNTNSHDVKLTINKKDLENAPDLDIEKLKMGDREEVDKMIGFYGESDFANLHTTEEDNNDFKQPDEHEHEQYEGSADITGQDPTEDSQQASKNMDYEKSKGLK